MNDELLHRLTDSEDNFTERKPESVNSYDIRRTLVAFANSLPENRTGVLFIGVADDGSILGVKNHDNIVKKITEECREKCYPPIDFQTDVIDYNGCKIVSTTIFPSNNRPHFAGQSYVRFGSESIKASDDIFNEIIHRRTSKVNEILKWKDKIVTVTSIGKYLGTIQTKIFDMSEDYECQIISCSVFNLRLLILGKDKRVSEPMENVSLSYDENKHRLQIIVKFKM